MRLSYIVPVYKVEKYLKQCVDSILAQTMDEYEIILVDDGSPDTCPTICDEYEREHPDIIKVIHKENGGLASARNAGFDVARGEYVFFFDSDDFLTGDGVKKILCLAEESKADILHNSYYSFNEKNGEKTTTVIKFEEGKVYSHEDMEKEICRSNSKRFITFVWRNLYRREFLISNGIRFEERLRMIEDAPFDTWAFTKAERFVAVDAPIYCYRWRDDSLQRQKYVKDYDKIIEFQSDTKIKYYTENCTPRKEFFEDLAEYTVVSLFPILVYNIYKNKVEDRYSLLKRIGNSEMMRRSFRDYDIKKFKSKSLDWWMTWCVKHKLYPIAHFLCDKVIYK